MKAGCVSFFWYAGFCHLIFWYGGFEGLEMLWGMEDLRFFFGMQDMNSKKWYVGLGTLPP